MLQNKTDNVLVNITCRRVHVTKVAVKKAINITYSERLSVASRKVNAPYHIAICGLSDSTIFFRIVS